MSPRLLLSLSSAALLALCSLQPLPALHAADTPKRVLRFEDVLNAKDLSDPQVSPDGRWLVYVTKTANLEANNSRSHLWLLPLDGSSAPRQLTVSDKNERNPRWSPDGRWIAFESNRDGTNQIWVLPFNGGEARRLTKLSTGAENPLWSPDGRSLAFSSSVFPEFSAKPFAEADKLNAEKLESLEKGQVKARVLTQLLYRHWDSWVNGQRTHLFLQPLTAELQPDGLPRNLTPGDNDAQPTSSTFSGSSEFAFSADGKQLFFTTPPLPLREQSWNTNHELWSLDLATGNRSQLTTNPAADGLPRPSPDGRLLAYRAQRRPGFEADRWELMVLDLSTGASRSLTSSFDRSVEDFLWSADGQTLYFSVEDQAASAVFRLTLSDTRPTLVYRGGSTRGFSLSPDGRSLVFTQSRLTAPAEIVRLPFGSTQPIPLTQANRELLADIELPQPESVTVPGAGGTPVQMWILRPPHFDATRKYPLVFWVHGGPQGAWEDGWSRRWNAQLWAAQGYVLAMPNPRGSSGFGQQFTDEISKDYGGKVYEDLMLCLAWLEQQPYVDTTRMATAGASFGGYMMNWFQGHTDKFRTIITHAGLYNLSSMYGTTEEVWFSEWDSGKPWELADPDKYSPHHYAKNFRTPNLIIHGELDYRVPISQAQELFTTLQRRGIPSKFLWFPDENHWIQKPRNSELWHKTVFEWLDEYIGQGSQAGQTPPNRKDARN